MERYEEDVCHWMLRCPCSMGAIVNQLSLLEEGCECKGSQGQRLVATSMLVMPCTNHIFVNHLSARWYGRLGV